MGEKSAGEQVESLAVPRDHYFPSSDTFLVVETRTDFAAVLLALDSREDREWYYSRVMWDSCLGLLNLVSPG